MPSVSSLLASLHSYVLHISQQSGSRKWMTALAIVITIMWLYKRVELARLAERRGPQLRDARGRLLPANVALNQHAPSPVPAAHASSSDALDVRHLTPAQRYLSDRGSRVRRQAVCITLSADNGLIFERRAEGEGEAASSLGVAPSLRVQDAIAPLLISLAQHTLLHFIAVEPDVQRQKDMLRALSDIGLMESGLKQHRVLFCSTVKGKTSLVRHLEPNLCLDGDRAMLVGLAPFIDQCVQVGQGEAAAAAAGTPAPSAAAASSAVANRVPTFASLPAFFASSHTQV